MGKVIMPKKDSVIHLSDKLDQITNTLLVHWCPGCEQHHLINIGPATPGRMKWYWNGDVLSPTLTPSYSLNGHCEYNIENGIIYFGIGCTHALSGQATPLPNLPK